MPKVELTECDLIEIIRLRDQDKLTQSSIAKIFGVTQGNISHFLAKKTHTEFWEAHERKPIASGKLDKPRDNLRILEGKRFFITSAQNNTHAFKDGLRAIKRYCKEVDAQLIVGRYTYNKNGFQNGTNQDDLWFDREVRDHIINEPCQLAEGLIFCGNINSLPTVQNPLNRFQNYYGLDSIIIPHAKQQMLSGSTPMHDDAKLMYTTGTVTQKNYIQKTPGQIAEWNHIFGGLIVEIDGDGDWFVRQVNIESDTGNFYDLTNYYTPTITQTDCRVLAINWGDLHVAKLNGYIQDACWGSIQHSLQGILDPDYVFLHDVHDHNSRNHHNIKDCYEMFRRFTNKKESVKDEVQKTVDVITDMQWCSDTNIVVVESNHDKALERWLKEQDYKRDPVNAVFFLQMQLAMYESIEEGVQHHTFEYACALVNDGPLNAQFLRTDESFRLKGVEFGQHGDKGSGGARGSIASFVKQGVKFNVGHSHGAAIKDGVFQAGVCMKPCDSGYVSGGCNWSLSHIITYHNSKRTIITMKQKANGEWRFRA